MYRNVRTDDFCYICMQAACEVDRSEIHTMRRQEVKLLGMSKRFMTGFIFAPFQNL